MRVQGWRNSNKEGADLPFAARLKAFSLLPIVSLLTKGFVMGMIFDPSTPTPCKLVYKERDDTYFPIYTLGLF